VELPDLNDVRVFVMIGQEGTLTAAAKALNLPTSTVSRALTRLERHLEVLLVQRSPRGVTLTDFGAEYLQLCRKALRTLRDGSELLEGRRERPTGLLKISCPITMARFIFAPLLKEFLDRYPGLRVEIEPYVTGWEQEPKEDVDVFFKVRAPKDSIRRVRLFPGTKRGLFASKEYIAGFGNPKKPEDLPAHSCIGFGVWKLTRNTKSVTPNIIFKIVLSDPGIHLDLVLKGIGIGNLPLYLACRPGIREKLVPVLPSWIPEPISLCALFSGPARLTPKVGVLLDFLNEYLGTDRDPRLYQLRAEGFFTNGNRMPRSDA
jgi:DNA-binding transcriptional LysR family regulator